MTVDHQPPDSAVRPRICHDPVTGRPVFLAPQRGGKPDDRALVSRLGDEAGPRGWCPFCAGNESRTPADVARWPADPAAPWRARIVPNTFPITVAQPGASEPGEPRESAGTHDVVIESPRHDQSILGIETDDWRQVWALCRQRLAALADCPHVRWATVFKNSGARAGASLEHVHSQIVGLDLVPPAIAWELETVARDPGTFRRLLDEADRDGRVVAERGGLVAVVPPAPRQPYETWLLVADPEIFFHETDPARVASVADLTRDLVGRFDSLVPGAHFNWWLHQPPYRHTGRTAGLEGWHWHLEIMPRLAELAGFEIGTGCHITTLTAREAARRLRDAAPPTSVFPAAGLHPARNP